MKQAIIELKKKLLIVELPEGATDVHINDLVYKNKVSFRTNTSLHFIETKENLLGEAPKLIGKLTDITEEQFAEWVECFGIGRWRNYLIESQYIEYLKPTAKESFFSYLESQGVYFSNPLGKKPDGTPILFSQRNGALELLEWQEAEQKVWNKNLIYVFEII